MLRSGWIPAALTAALTAVFVVLYGVSAADVAKFSAYLLLVVVVPGTLLWRLLRGGSGLLAADVAAGTALGYALSVLVYLALRAVGLPQLAVVPTLAVLGLFAGVPGLRRHWRGSGERTPWWWSWLLAGFVLVLVAWSGINFFRGHGLDWPGDSTPYPDIPFQQALAGELKNHFPGRIPFVAGEPLHYHYFFHAHLAAASWGTGIELQVLLLRLAVLPMLAALVVLVAVLAKQITGAWWAGPAAVFLTFFAAAPFGRYSTATPLTVLWTSPTQSFGNVVFAGLAYLLILMWRGTPRRTDWALFAVLTLGVAGGKATFLPMLLAALALVAVAELVARRRVGRTTLTAFLIVLALLGVAMVFIFGGSSTGLEINFLGSMYRPGRARLAVLAGAILAWCIAWAGIAGLFWRRRFADRAVLLCLGLGLAGFGAVLLTTQPGASQYYFLMSARPYLALAAVAGLVNLLSTRTRVNQLLAALLVGIMVFSAFSDSELEASTIKAATTQGPRAYPKATHGQIPRGGVEAARWLRDHSSPDDLVATNVHCLMVRGRCDNRSFWVSAYAERRMLVEGWAYAPTWYPLAVKAVPDYHVLPYWKPQVLADNDAVFAHPTKENVARLRQEYGVRWLFVDKRLTPNWADLKEYANLVYDRGDAAVFELPAA
ncbi:hypothetical protein [Hamadaea tsunoensis]|uniref:hypothetical protein n=1 Tax=Hamadaea tsunoensis TaxID=53368 RepID=UPI000427FFC8|nr:hypothetical protein [Hamadaea tsunoensis]